ncbi:MAG: hypothetical protein RRA92_07490 [Gemmatimonadota bacterium]|nr:hypothetical protein [Gemmatimonadota bacterium]
MIDTRKLLLGACMAVVLGPSGASGQDFEWEGRVAAGDAVEIRNINGGIRALAADGDRVVVTAAKRDNGRGDPADVRIEVVEHAGGVTLCAVYPAADGHANECRPGGKGRLEAKDNDVSVEFTVRLPAGVALEAKTVNGGVEAAGLRGDVIAGTVNGAVRVSTTGIARASTVNGSIDAVLGRADWKGDLAFETVNGGITVSLPADAAARVRATTVNGGLETDFPLTVQGRFANRRIEGTIGGGGRDLEMKTVNGSIRLKKAG